MTANELRIGNLVSNMNPRHNDSILTIESIGDNHEVNMFYRKYLLSELEPIPLTEEWLFKFGFTICENYAWYEKKIPTLGIAVSCNLHGGFSIDYKYDVVTIRDCCYNVHQLQNLYFALTGEELTFKSE